MGGSVAWHNAKPHHANPGHHERQPRRTPNQANDTVRPSACDRLIAPPATLRTRRDAGRGGFWCVRWRTLTTWSVPTAPPYVRKAPRLRPRRRSSHSLLRWYALAPETAWMRGLWPQEGAASRNWSASRAACGATMRRSPLG